MRVLCFYFGQRRDAEPPSNRAALEFLPSDTCRASASLVQAAPTTSLPAQLSTAIEVVHHAQPVSRSIYEKAVDESYHLIQDSLRKGPLRALHNPEDVYQAGSIVSSLPRLAEATAPGILANHSSDPSTAAH